jgi:hypothetical protein
MGAPAPAASGEQEIAPEESQRITVRTSAPRLALRIHAPHGRSVEAQRASRPSSAVRLSTLYFRLPC